MVAGHDDDRVVEFVGCFEQLDGLAHVAVPALNFKIVIRNVAAYLGSVRIECWDLNLVDRDAALRTAVFDVGAMRITGAEPETKGLALVTLLQTFVECARGTAGVLRIAAGPE